jgi:hypothetical protein
MVAIELTIWVFDIEDLENEPTNCFLAAKLTAGAI